MSEEAEPEKMKARVPWWLWLGSAVWLVAVFSIAWFVFWPTDWKSVKPNEFGDLLAGAFSPVAFAWFVYAVFMQREELELQRQELTETREVLKEQKSAQEESAKSAKILSEITFENLKQYSLSNNINIFNNYAKIIDEYNLQSGDIVYFSKNGMAWITTSTSDATGRRFKIDLKRISEQLQSVGSMIAANNFEIDKNDILFKYINTLLLLINTMETVCNSDELRTIFIAAGYEDLQRETLSLINAQPR